MKTIPQTISEVQRLTCDHYSAAFFPPLPNLNCGFAFRTKGQLPINGLRHSLTETTTGWFLWCGETFSEASDWFVPICTAHLYEEIPEIAPFLALPPGYRFLVAGDYVDVWFDASLLNM